MLHPELFEMIKMCKQITKAKVMLSTNGSLLDEPATEKIIASDFDEIIISLDAVENQEIYNLIRNAGNLSTVNNNVEYFLFQNKSVNVILQFIDMFINREERELFKEKRSKHNQNISIQCLYTWANQLPFMNLASDNMGHMYYYFLKCKK